jgi:hypothetical protein
MRYEVSVRDGVLHLFSGPSDDRDAFSDEGPHEFDLYPADASGDNFVARSDDRQPWSSVVFGRLGDQEPYMFLGGRITPRAG